MQTQLTLLHTGLLVIVAMVSLEFIRLLVRGFYRKTVETEYITVAGCRQCRDECLKTRSINDGKLGESLKKLGDSIDVLRSIVLVLAVNVGVDETTLKQLAMKKAS